jgi:ParB/RepB/Spo0J family partition protein
MARAGSLAALRAGIRATVEEMGDTAAREAEKTANLERGERARWATLPHEQIVPDPAQPRKLFDEEKLRTIAESIRAVGLREPLRVYPLGVGGRYRILDGQRRWHAIDMLLDEGLERHRDVIVLVDEAPSSDARLRVEQLITSVHKEAFVPLETAAALLFIAEHAAEGEPLPAVRLAETYGFNPKFTERHLRVARGLNDAERELLLEHHPKAALDPLEKLVAWLAAPTGAGLDAAGRRRVIEAFARKKPAARILDIVLRPYAAKKPAGRPRKVQFRAGPTSGGGFAVNLRIPPNRARDAGALDQAERDLVRALDDLRRFRGTLDPEAGDG